MHNIKKVLCLLLILPIITVLISFPLNANASTQNTIAVTISPENEYQVFKGWGVKNGTMTNGNNIDQYDYCGYDNQQWKFKAIN